ncbi:hypothetical protein SASPL_113658 [Salvia splendens]|uniref:GPI inositol-deacylase PGAP1-like alpha/beta domain-containing protein n=1 Tax=Salvia splendens TaxID=180675 RepID=A0A8X8ZZP7_SALSN|nr:uncharacterized protein LOC121802391 [Salvia splendens]KAG6423267.1 hypothetical protein SASPL_113658 [Salvia splendens]
MAVALASPPLPPPPSQLQLSVASKRSCRYRCTSPLSQTDSSSSCRPAVILPGLGNNTTDYQKLALILKDYGVPTVTAKVSRIDWLRNAAGLLDSNYWRGTLRPRPVLDWYLQRVEEAVYEAKELAQGSTVSLIGHSAGGWLARVYLQEYGTSDISLLLTLGTPHLALPKGISGVIDQTRGLLDYVDKHCAKAVYTPELRYVCIAGRYIQGVRLLGSSSDENPELMVETEQPVGEMSVVKTSAPASATLQARFVGQGYKQVCGQADVWGDGVVPEVSAHLKGALNISLDGVYHSPVGSEDETRPWYGSPAVVQQWIHHLLN